MILIGSKLHSNEVIFLTHIYVLSVTVLNEALAQFFAELRTENGKGCLDNFALYVINK